MNTIVHVNLVLKSLFFLSFQTKFQLIFSYSLPFSQTLSFISHFHSSCSNYFLLLLFCCCSALFTKFPVLTMLLPHCYYWRYDLPDAVICCCCRCCFCFSVRKCIREFHESETLPWECAIPPYMNMCYSGFIFQLYTHANHISNSCCCSISYY